MFVYLFVCIIAPHHDLTPESDKLALSGSTDCSVRLWCLNSGETLRSIYTYNSVTCLGLIANSGYIVSGSGKFNQLSGIQVDICMCPTMYLDWRPLYNT